MSDALFEKAKREFNHKIIGWTQWSYWAQQHLPRRYLEYDRARLRRKAGRKMRPLTHLAAMAYRHDGAYVRPSVLADLGIIPHACARIIRLHGCAGYMQCDWHTCEHWSHRLWWYGGWQYRLGRR